MKPLPRAALSRVGRMLVESPQGAGDDGLAREAEQAARDPRNLVGHYVLLAEVGRGAAGVVYRAYDRTLRRSAAVKVIDVPDLDEARLRRLEREFVAMARLRHPHIVAVYDAGLDRGRLYCAMEWMEGLSLQHAIRSGPLEPRRAAGFIRMIAGALDSAHRAGFLHQDLKPSNILLSGDVPKLADFGAVRSLIPSGDTSMFHLRGTPGYMAPEQAAGRPSQIDQRTDVYGLGATLHALVTGRPPGTGAIPDRRLRAIVDKATRRNPAERYASAAGLGEAVGAWLRRRRWMGPALLAAAAVALLAAIFWWNRAEARAWRLLDAGDYDPAVLLFEELLQRDASQPDRHRGYLRAVLGSRLRRFRFHRQRYDDFAALVQGDLIASSASFLLRAGDPGGRLVWDLIADRTPDSPEDLPVELLLLRGMTRLYDGAPEARMDLGIALLRRPESREARHALALLELESGDERKALELAQSLDGPDARRMEAACRLILGDAAEAIRLLEGLGDDLPEARADLGTARLQKGDHAGAEREYRAALKQDAGCYVAAYHLAVALGKQDRSGEAVEVLEKALLLARSREHLHAEPAGDFGTRSRLSDCFYLFPRDFVQNDPDLAPVRDRPDYVRRIVPLLR